MNLRTLERIRQEWQFAADSMPQLICLVDRAGRVMHANRTLERWKLGEVEETRGVDLHDVLHKRCADQDCYLRSYWQRSAAALARNRRAECDVWDPLLKRHFEIRTQMPLPDEGADSEDFFAVVTIDDVTESKASEDQPRHAARIPSQRVEHEEQNLSEWVLTEEALRVTQNELWRLSAQHLTIQESERRRIAVDLHNGLGQTLSLVKLSIEEAALSARAGGSGKVAATLGRLAPTVKSALAELRRIAMNLRPSTLDDLGILATLSWYFREFEAACPNMNLERDISVKESDVPELLKIAIFRIIQEATSNAFKHAGADRIKVCLSNERGTLELLIEDTGRGFDQAAAAGQRAFNGGLGLQSMKERAELSGASYEIQSAPGKGTSICARWPVLQSSKREWVAKTQPLVQATGMLPFPDQEMPDRYSACLACMRSLRRSP